MIFLFLKNCNVILKINRIYPYTIFFSKYSVFINSVAWNCAYYIFLMCKKHFMQDSNNILIELFYLESPQTLGKKFKWILKVWNIYVVGVVVDVGVNFTHFHILLQNHGANFNQTWHKASLGRGDSSLFKWRAIPFSKRR